MTSFRFQAMDSTGRPTEGVVDAESESEATEILQRRGDFVTAISVAAESAPNDSPPETNSPTDWQSARPDVSDVYRPLAERSYPRFRSIRIATLISSLLVSLIVTAVFWNQMTWYWFFGLMLAFGATAEFVLVPRPWPNCPACHESMTSLGSYCPICGDHLNAVTPRKKAKCTGCHDEIWIDFPRSIPVRQETRLHDPKSYHAPIYFCTHCGAKLADAYSFDTANV